MRRREFVAGVGLVAVAPAPAASPIVDTAVVGAGLAGLETASILAAGGARVAVFEASSRVGGRVRTATAKGLRFETGATEFADSYARCQRRIAELGLRLTPTAGTLSRELALCIGDELMNAASWPSSPANNLPSPWREQPPPALLTGLLQQHNPLATSAEWLKEAHSALDVSLHSYLASKGVPGPVLELADVGANYNSLRETSALDALRRDAMRKDASAQGGVKLLEGGSEALPQAIASRLGDRIRRNAPVAAIERVRRRFRLRLTSGETIEARTVVVAVPCAQVDRIAFDGIELADIAALWQARPMTAISQVHLQPTAPFWDEDGLPPTLWSDGALERVFAIRNADQQVERLLVWLNGRGAQRADRLSDADLAQYVPLELARIRPASAGKVEVLHVVRWAAMPGIGGAYAEVAPGAAIRVRDALSAIPSFTRRHPGLAFAGEHMAFDVPGMEAALASAERAAASIADAL